jgi:hypothetical protein
LALGLCAAAPVLWLVGAAGATRAVCTPGLTKVGGVTARTFCGPARATVKVGGKTFSLANGNCDRTARYVSVNIGTVVLGLAKKKPDYFGLNVGRILGAGKPAPRDGTYHGSALALDAGGKGYAVRADEIEVTLTGNRTKGTFTATLLAGGSISGSFSC